MMAKALRTVESREGSQVMCYIDDVIIATETVEDHLVRLREVFECLKKAGLKCKSAKCSFMKTSDQVSGSHHRQRWRATGPRSRRAKSKVGRVLGIELNSQVSLDLLTTTENL